jgi:hypothetical protein
VNASEVIIPFVVIGVAVAQSVCADMFNTPNNEIVKSKSFFIIM